MFVEKGLFEGGRDMDVKNEITRVVVLPTARTSGTNQLWVFCALKRKERERERG